MIKEFMMNLQDNRNPYLRIFDALAGTCMSLPVGCAAYIYAVSYKSEYVPQGAISFSIILFLFFVFGISSFYIFLRFGRIIVNFFPIIFHKKTIFVFLSIAIFLRIFTLFVRVL